MTDIRVRFAPSPTGSMHIGNLRTAIFDYLTAKSLGGKLILRIEDTDQKREVEGAIEQLTAILDWMSIKFDEGPNIGGEYGPYVQSQRLDIYNRHLDNLLKSGGAYRCFCTAERLEKMRQEQQEKKLPPRYDRMCRDLGEKEIDKRITAGEKFVVRQKMPIDGKVVVSDELRGEIKFQAADLDDHVLIKSNGIPTYQFANVIDDHEMKISHVLRGDEWISSLPKNFLLYQAFGWTPPKFFHLPLVLDKNGGKLSKRKGDVAVENYREKGYLPEALFNFCALLGWHPKNDVEILSAEQLIKEFNIKNMGVSPAVFDIEKLDYLNGYYIRHMEIRLLLNLCRPYLFENINKTNDKIKKTDDFLIKVIKIEQERLKILSEIGELTEFFFIDKLEFPDELLIWKKLTIEQAKENLKTVYGLLEKIPDNNWTNNSIGDDVMSYLNSKELKVGEYLWPMRVALTGRKASPSPFDVAEILGKKETLTRLKYSMK